ARRGAIDRSLEPSVQNSSVLRQDGSGSAYELPLTSSQPRAHSQQKTNSEKKERRTKSAGRSRETFEVWPDSCNGRNTQPKSSAPTQVRLLCAGEWWRASRS